MERQKLLVWSNGKEYHYNFVNYVANYAIVYPPIPPAKLVVPMAERKLKKIAEAISKKETRPYPKSSAFGFIYYRIHRVQ